MTVEKDNDILIQTKFHRPSRSRDHVHRKDLLIRLNRGLGQVLTLVSAPAGYGKSTLISCWLEDVDTPHCWLSVDEKDNDLRIFLLYLVTAIQTISKSSCSDTMAMLKGAQMPPVSLLHQTLINEIDKIETSIILVIDDYHLIREQQIHTFINYLLENLPADLHMVLISRRDPPLPVASWRATGQLIEIRTQDLRFSLAESELFLNHLTGVEVDKTVVSMLDAKTEGWVTGLRLAALSLMHRADLKTMLTALPAENRYVLDYILQQVLAQHPPQIQDCILRISILNRFCAPLCEALCLPDAAANDEEISNTEFLTLLEESNVFTVSLDDDGTWFRYHHLIGKIFRRQLKKRFKQEHITLLYKRASIWFASYGFLEEALSYSLEIEDYQAAAELVETYRLDLINKEQYYQLDHWLKKFPTDIIYKRPQLLLSQAWVYQRQARYSKLFEILKQLAITTSNTDTSLPEARTVRGELASLQSFFYFTTAQPKRAEDAARRALQLLPVHFQLIRGFALVILAAALHMLGASEKSRKLLYDELRRADEFGPAYKSALLIALCFPSWIDGDLNSLKPVATQVLKNGQNHSLPESIAFGSYFSGILHYQRNKLVEAENFLKPVTEGSTREQLAIPSIITYCQSSFALSLTYLATGRGQEANDIAEALISYMLETGNIDLLEICQTFQVELHLRQGKVLEASNWAKSYAPHPLIPAYRFYTPQLTLPKILLHQATGESFIEADKMLTQLQSFYLQIKCRNVLIHVYALQALLEHARGENNQAQLRLRKALDFAQPGWLLRPFLDLGCEMKLLLDQQSRTTPDDEFTASILKAFDSEKPTSHYLNPAEFDNRPPPSTAHVSSSPLTNREIEVLRLLAKGVSNNEIAGQLYISSETVKRHLSTIYRKLAVKNRHQAVISGKSIGII